MAPDESLQQKLDLERVRKHVDELAGKFDTVQILVTRYDMTTGGTVSVSVGTGNWHARRGQIYEWLLKADTVSQEEAIEERDE